MPEPTYHQVTDPAQLAGKTIERALRSERDDGDCIVFVFSDNSYVYMHSYEENAWIATDRSPPLGVLVEAGLATQQQRETFAHFNARTEEWRRDVRRREYERLRAEFAGEGPASSKTDAKPGET